METNENPWAELEYDGACEGGLAERIQANVCCQEDIHGGGSEFDTYKEIRDSLVSLLEDNDDDFELFTEALNAEEIPNALEPGIVPKKYWQDLLAEAKKLRDDFDEEQDNAQF